MKTSLDQLPKPLPPAKLEELAMIKQLILERFEKENHDFKLEKIILFGSYARGKWVEDSYVQAGITYEYKSDFDMLVVTQQGISESHWLALCIAENLDKRPTIRTEVNIIHHGIQFLNEKLEENYYFFVDIAQEGVLLYDTGRYQLATPGLMTPARRYQKAQEELEYWTGKAEEFYDHYLFDIEKGRYSIAAFELHQATESYYNAIMLVFTDYKPRKHNLKKLGKQAVSIDARFQEVFPLRNRKEKELFQLLKKAYIDARYKKDYHMGEEALTYLGERVQLLAQLIQAICQQEIARLKG